jgi:hypothetical protein
MVLSTSFQSILEDLIVFFLQRHSRSIHVTSNCSKCSEHASSALYTSNPFTDRAEAAYLSPLLVKQVLGDNRFQSIETTIPMTPLCQSS